MYTPSECKSICETAGCRVYYHRANDGKCFAYNSKHKFRGRDYVGSSNNDFNGESECGGSNKGAETV